MIINPIPKHPASTPNPVKLYVWVFILIAQRFPIDEKLFAVKYSKDAMFENGTTFPVTSVVFRPKINPPKMNTKRENKPTTKTYFHFFRFANSLRTTFALYFFISLI